MASDDNTKRNKFGSRVLTVEEDVFSHNAWDDFEWTEDDRKLAEEKVDTNSAVKLSDEDKEGLDLKAGEHWDNFYKVHDHKFFKDRQWLFTEFPELLIPNQEDGWRKIVFEIGCGCGNTVFPLLKLNHYENVYVYCCDISNTAIDIVKTHTDYNTEYCHAFVLDVAEANVTFPFQLGTVSICSMIFVLSALKPEDHAKVLSTIYDVLEPGGLLLFRDYARYDLSQLRFKPGQCLDDNFYVRGDKTRVYFFDQAAFEALVKSIGFEVAESCVDNRLIVNRARRLKMHRFWLQCKLSKPTKN